jgi:hypothetical protein
MKRKKVFLIAICFLLGVVMTLFLIPKNTPLAAFFLNKNSIEVAVENDLDKGKIKIQLFIRGTSFENVTVFENGCKSSIPKGYGENDWFLSYDQKNYGSFRHFKTNNWHDHHYSFVFYKTHGEVFCDIHISGPDEVKKTTIKLDKKTEQNDIIRTVVIHRSQIGCILLNEKETNLLFL